MRPSLFTSTTTNSNVWLTTTLLQALIALLASAPSPARAEVVQDNWTFPQNPDHASTLVIGKKVTIGWTASLQDWFPAFCPGCVPTAATLYITSVGISGQLPFKHKIASKIDVTKSLGLDWTVALPDDEIDCQGCGNWAFRFMADGYSGDVSSSIFSVTNSTVTATTTAAAVTSPPNTSTLQIKAVPTTPAAVPSPSATNYNGDAAAAAAAAPSSSGLSAGAKAGLGIGITLAAIFLVLLGWFLAKWQRRRHSGVGVTRWPSPSDAGGRGSPGMYIETNGRSISRLSRTIGAISPIPRHKHHLDSDDDDGEGKMKWDPEDTFYRPPPGAPASAITVTTTLTRTTEAATTATPPPPLPALTPPAAAAGAAASKPISSRSSGISNHSVPDFLALPPLTPDSPTIELLPRSPGWRS